MLKEYWTINSNNVVMSEYVDTSIRDYNISVDNRRGYKNKRKAELVSLLNKLSLATSKKQKDTIQRKIDNLINKYPQELI